MVVLRHVVDAENDRHFRKKAFGVVRAGAERQTVNAWLDGFRRDEPRAAIGIRSAFEDDAVVALQRERNA